METYTSILKTAANERLNAHIFSQGRGKWVMEIIVNGYMIGKREMFSTKKAALLAGKSKAAQELIDLNAYHAKYYNPNVPV